MQVSNKTIKFDISIVFIIFSIIAVCFAYSRKHLLAYFTMIEILLISQLSLTIVVLFIFIFFINKASLFRKLINLKRDLNRNYLYNLLFIVIILPILVLYGLYIQKNYNLTHAFQITTAMKFIAYQIIGGILFQEQITRRNIIAVLFFLIGILFTFEY